MLLTLRARAEEHHREDGLFADPTAAAWVEKLPWPPDYDRFLTKGFKASFVVRSRLYDDLTAEFLQRTADPLVVELGAGLSTRAYRLVEHGGRWLFLDLGEALGLRGSVEPNPPANFRFATADLIGGEWVQHVGHHPPEQTLFIAEGVLLFLREKSVADLVEEMRRHFAEATFLLDASSHGLREKQGQRFAEIDAPVMWTVDDESDVAALGLDVRRVWPVLAQFPQRWGDLVPHPLPQALKNNSLLIEAGVPPLTP